MLWIFSFVFLYMHAVATFGRFSLNISHNRSRWNLCTCLCLNCPIANAPCIFKLINNWICTEFDIDIVVSVGDFWFSYCSLFLPSVELKAYREKKVQTHRPQYICLHIMFIYIPHTRHSTIFMHWRVKEVSSRMDFEHPFDAYS